MDMNLCDRETQLSLIMVAFLLYLFSPIAYWLWLLHELDSGAFPVDADSIGIPLAGFMVLWFVGLVIIPTTTILIVIGRNVLKKDRVEKLR
jgi:hypothetical protein